MSYPPATGRLAPEREVRRPWVLATANYTRLEPGYYRDVADNARRLGIKLANVAQYRERADALRRALRERVAAG